MTYQKISFIHQLEGEMWGVYSFLTLKMERSSPFSPPPPANNELGRWNLVCFDVSSSFYFLTASKWGRGLFFEFVRCKTPLLIEIASWNLLGRFSMDTRCRCGFFALSLLKCFSWNGGGERVYIFSFSLQNSPPNWDKLKLGGYFLI